METKILSVTCLVLAIAGHGTFAQTQQTVSCGSTIATKRDIEYNLNGPLPPPANCSYTFKSVPGYRVVFKCTDLPHDPVTAGAPCGDVKLKTNSGEKCQLAIGQPLVSSYPQTEMKIEITSTNTAATYQCKVILELDACNCGGEKTEEPGRQRSDAFLISNSATRAFDCAAVIVSPKILITTATCAQKLNARTPKIVEVGTGTSSQRDYTVNNVTIMPSFNSATRSHDVAVLDVTWIDFNDNVGPACVLFNGTRPGSPSISPLLNTRLRVSTSSGIKCNTKEAADHFCRTPKNCDTISGSGLTMPVTTPKARNLLMGLSLNKNCATGTNTYVEDQGLDDQAIRNFIRSRVDTAICSADKLVAPV